jgi:hypothetical protein
MTGVLISESLAGGNVLIVERRECVIITLFYEQGN